VAIVNALQLEAARATPVHSRFNYNAMPSLKWLNLYCRIIAFLLQHVGPDAVARRTDIWTARYYKLFSRCACGSPSADMLSWSATAAASHDDIHLPVAMWIPGEFRLIELSIY